MAHTIADSMDLNSLKLHQAGAEIEFPAIFGFLPWRHYVEIVTKCKTIEEALFYSQSTGIRRVFRIQKERYFPLPDYDLSNRQQVKVCIYGRILDENYSQILFKNPDFDLETVFLIDCVQKGIRIDKSAVKYLRKLKVIEGKVPNIFLFATISETIGEKDQYVKNKAFDDQYYKDLIVKYLEQYGSAKKKDIRTLLWDKLPEIMEDKQKEDKVRNLLSSMRKKGIITTTSKNQQKSSWVLVDKTIQDK